MCLQKTTRRRIWKKSCSQEDDMIIFPLFSLFLTCSLLRLPAASSKNHYPPLLPQLHKWRSHDITLQPVGGRLHPLFRQGSYLDAVLQCTVLHGNAWAEHAEINTPVSLKLNIALCNTRCCAIMLLLKSILQDRVMWEDMTCQPSVNQPGVETYYFYCSWLLFFLRAYSNQKFCLSRF